jgi:hypothetical protein
VKTPQKLEESQRWDQDGMHRRDFLSDGIKVSLSFLAWDALSLPMFAQTGPPAAGQRLPLDRVEAARVPADLSDSLDVVAAYLAQYAPPAGDFPASGAWTATCDLIEWEGAPNGEQAKFFRRNRVIGRQAVTRRPGVETVGYELDHTLTIKGFVTRLRSTMRCANDGTPGLIDWQTDYEMHPVRWGRAPLRLREQGTHRNGVLEIASSAGTRRIPTERPVAPQWAVWDALRGAAVVEEFDLLHDLTSYWPRQRLKPSGELQISLDGRRQHLHGFVQTGGGTQPTHYWIDAAGRPLLVTGGLLSSALVSIQPAPSGPTMPRPNLHERREQEGERA